MSQTKKYLIFFSYIGSGFRGSQIQKKPNAAIETVQDVIEKGLKYLFKLEGERPIRINLASRTDVGVHALRAALIVNLPIFGYDFIKPNVLVRLLNYYFSQSQCVRIIECHFVPDSFTFSKVNKEKTYLYRVGFLKEEFWEDRYKKYSPILELERTFLIRFSKIFKTFDLKKAQDAASLFEGIKDFGNIGKPYKNIIPRSNITPTICNIISYKVQESQPLFPLDPSSQRFCFYQFICKGDRFLRHMVRRMVSLTLSVGLNMLNLEDIQKLFDEPQFSSWPKKAFNIVPGYGLYLVDIKIDLENFLQKEELSGKRVNEIPLRNDNKDMV